ncbi:glycosyltransferase [Aestuariimicrobium soli]|uniref:glycosyltransferase n=1 Tax=Aestuariimicrobium soli TaxID=2035834 RepID=UPI003EBF5B03
MLIIALGSRGDVQPMAILARAIVAHGTPVTIVALAEYESLVRSHGADFVPVPVALAEVMSADQRRLRGPFLGSQPVQALVLQRWLMRTSGLLADAMLAAAADHDVVLGGILAAEATAVLGANGWRSATVLFAGLLPTSTADSHFQGRAFTPSARYNRMATGVAWRLSCRLGRSAAHALSRQVSGDRARGSQRPDVHPLLVAASPTLVPPADDWPMTVRQTGHLVEDDPAAATALATDDPGLVSFLAAGPPPVHIGFGSMAVAMGHDDQAEIIKVARLTGQRVVTPMLPGARPGLVADNVYAHAPTPHAGVFSSMAALVHHGGSGTTFAGLRSGVPSVAMPFAFDQPHHAWRLHRLGVGPVPISAKRFGASTIAWQVDQLTTGPSARRYAERAAEVGEQCRAEDGLGDTLTALDELALLR